MASTFWSPCANSPFQNTFNQIIAFLIAPLVYRGIWAQGSDYFTDEIVLYGDTFYQLLNNVINAQDTPDIDPVNYVVFNVLSAPTLEDLANPANSFGADLVSNADRSIATIAALRAFPKPDLAPGRTLVVSVQEYATGTGKGGGQFRWQANSNQADDNGRVINPTGNVGAGRWIRIDPRITVEQYGAVGDGVTNDATTIQAVLTQYNTGPLMREICFDSPSYKCNTGLTQNSTFCSVVGESLLDFTGTVGITALTITSSISPEGGNHYGRKAAMKGLRLVGPASRATDGSRGIRFDSAVAGSTPGPLLERVMVYNFDRGHSHLNTSYISAGIQCEIYNCNVDIESLPGTDAGERITYIASTFYNSNTAISSTKVNSAFHLVACSIDYCNVVANMTAGKAFLTNCHIEAGDYAAEPIVLSGDGTTFVMNGGWLLNTSPLPNTIPYWANVGAGAYCALRPDFCNNTRTATDYWFTGAGRYEVKFGNSFDTTQNPRGLSLTQGYLADPGFELNSLSSDLRFISSDTAAITNQYTGANTAITISTTIARTGTYSLRWAKTGGNGSNASFVLGAIPVKAQDKIGATFWYRKPNASTGNVFFDFRFARIEWVGGIPTIVRSVLGGQITFALPVGDSGWLQASLAGNDLSIQSAPAWATHAVMVCNGVSWIGGGDFIYFDDLVLDIVG